MPLVIGLMPYKYSVHTLYFQASRLAYPRLYLFFTKSLHTWVTLEISDHPEHAVVLAYEPYKFRPNSLSPIGSYMPRLSIVSKSHASSHLGYPRLCLRKKTSSSPNLKVWGPLTAKPLYYNRGISYRYLSPKTPF